jgi:heptosyltransferase-2
MNKILIIGPAWVGDTVMAQTLFALLKKQDPTVVIDVLAPAHSVQVLLRMPEINQCVVTPFAHGTLNLRERFKLGRSLRAKGYQQAIVLPNSFKSALIPFFARIPHRIGWRGEFRYGVLNDVRVLDKKRYPLMIQRFAALAFPKASRLPETLPWPHLQTSQDSIETALQKYEIVKNVGQPILALCPGAEFGPAKRWPIEYFAQVAQQKLKEGWAVWLFGSPKEKQCGVDIQALCQNQCVDLIGRTALVDTIDLLSCANAVVANDSGLMHISAALNKPLVVVYGSTDPGFTPPLSKNVEILSLKLSCSPCFQRECPLGHLNCLKQLTPDKVLASINVLNEAR